MRLVRKIAVFVSLSALLAGAAGAAVPETPSLKPGKELPPAASTPVLSVNTATTAPAAAAPSLTARSSNALYLARALSAAERSQWTELQNLQYGAPDPVLKNVIMWKRASDGVPGMTFDELDLALTLLDGWPQTGKMRDRAEEIIELSSLDAKARIAWLEKSGPATGDGKVALANALRETGQRARADDVIKDAWRSNSLDSDVQRLVLARYGQSLSQDDHRARVDFLLWTGQTSAAEALKPQLTADYRKLTDARIALAKRAKNVDSAVSGVPDHLQSHPGLLYERAKWRRVKKVDGVSDLLRQIDGKDVPASGRGRLWDERAIATREELKLRNYARAYQLTAPHGMSSGGDFADAEWLAGWIALRLNGDATRSLGHFETMAAGVSSPVSVARGYYWTGRARDALGQADQAVAAYSVASTHKYTYYGQLASERLGDKAVDLGAPRVPTTEELAKFNANPVVQAMRLLGEAGESESVRQFAYFLDDQLTDPVEYELLSAMANELATPEVGVRVGKAGLQRGVVAPGAAYPVINPPISRKPEVERAFVLAITRQESEFNPNAISRVGARGLMQFMPATAKGEARLRGLGYQQSWLTDDPGYNLTLGGLHLDTLIKQFGGSYIMTAAAYNAGPSRPGQWVRDYGDPRTGQIDPIDWVEFIPFSETRNYVQRVMENIQVYRHRISGQPEDIRLSEDLKRGRR
ncbi:MAG: transglycosylase SLT domain-containing protein [Acidobacteria bacterium]|jgi:soluble lytic murein transglycosylase|nr:transglycosylase SLT domain-containing protein [Acidobacteriota bacterium]